MYPITHIVINFCSPLLVNQDIFNVYAGLRLRHVQSESENNNKTNKKCKHFNVAFSLCFASIVMISKRIATGAAVTIHETIQM